ncbi:hypothetical protein EN851_07865 [Mesorhizobium sp. M8A.F.Ca.ET.208.01.1.1]|uniref:hypothetical protein n=1 Tax=unclassified Mesorhizobium TaxID=325217 RepID=UPI00109415B3|nr:MULTISPECIES: hypothetical protein [unclassified Mesorhizobium]TGQ95425.1 hypothetical protein EN851_07865 [Mesorhizobium sp. M8A.F.Ca.ET.208.01.1.1]TGT55916.1 hypothetical protein EN810_07865 [Mesorhizobium sp. M8A.F.Ca.ET.167.01.1.1]
MADSLQVTGLANPWRAGRNSSGARLGIFDSGNNGADVLKRALAKVKPDDGGDAHFRFGKASRFTLTTPEQPTNPGATITWPPDDPSDDPKDGIVIDDFDYVDRSVELIRVTQKDEPDNYVIVERGLKYLFRDRQTGRYKRFNFDWSKKPSETEDHSQA